MMDLGISLVVGMMEGGGTYFLNILSLDAQSKAGFCFALLGRSVTELNPNHTPGRKRFRRCQIRCLICTKSTRGNIFKSCFAATIHFLCACTFPQVFGHMKPVWNLISSPRGGRQEQPPRCWLLNSVVYPVRKLMTESSGIMQHVHTKDFTTV